MDNRSQRGNVTRRLGASSFLLEFPDVQGESGHHRTHIESFPSQYQLMRDDARHDVFSGSQSLHWGVGREERPPPTAMTKCRLARSKRRPPPADPGADSAPSKDHVIFAESPVAPGVPVVYRPPEERAMNPDRLNLDRRHLTVCPILEGEERLRLLNLQHNSITRLQHLCNLRRLVFLDLYDNLVHEMSGLEGLLSLRVLMLGKNRIRKVAGLQTLFKLDVLDLHGNMIREIENLDHLSHLRVLNLAGNDLTCVSNLGGLQALTELNLRRNRITHVYGVDELPNLQRLFLSHNLIQRPPPSFCRLQWCGKRLMVASDRKLGGSMSLGMSFDDVACLAQCSLLAELTLDGTPLSNSPDHRLSIIYHIRHLRVLDQRPITDEEKSEALAAAREEEERQKEMHRQAQMQEHKEATIAAIKRAWEVTHKTVTCQLVPSASTQSLRPASTRRPGISLRSSSLPHLPPSYFVDHSGSTLHLYGPGALETLEAMPPHGSQPVLELCFRFIEFEELVPWLPRVGPAYPELQSLTLDYTNLTGLEQLNALASLGSSLKSLSIPPWGNPVTSHTFFFPYALFRLCHLGLTELNGSAIETTDVTEAERLFGNLGRLTTTQLPQARLLSLVTKYRPKSTGPKRTSIPSTDSLKRSSSSAYQEPLTRIALQYPHTDQPDAAQQIRHTAATAFCSKLVSSALATRRKTQTLEQLWPKAMATWVEQTLRDYSDLDKTMQSLLDRL